MLRTLWCIEPIWAEQHLPLVQSFLSGQFPIQTNEDDETQTQDPIAGKTFAIAAQSGSNYAVQNRYALDDPELPDNSVYVLDMRGVVVKESNCCSIGTEEYARLIRQAYAHEKIIGCVGLVDSPGGQLSGTPTLYDVIRDPIKPFVVVVNEGLMASAAYWYSCGADYIYASQQTDQIGSIGVYIEFDDATEAREKMGIKRHTIYSDRSSQKNRPFRDAKEGKTELIREDLNQAADLFRAAVEQGRGKRLKVAKKGGPDVFEGGLFYAGKAIELGLIDGYGNLETAIAKVAELASKPKGEAVEELPDDHDETGDNTPEVVDLPDNDDSDEPTASVEPTTSQSNLISTTMSLFGNPHKVLSGLAGVEGSKITNEQLNAANAELDAEKITGVRVISTTYLEQAKQSIAALNQKNAEVETLTKERDDARAEAAKFGSQPGAQPTKSEKVEEKITTVEKDTYISQTDADLAAMKAQMQ
ncbi:S49 family peptidase [Spirosoma aureum]|uniref:S49 family peptidase n=1 Tax=Spirosoma aureum TaxID=2692134 RepID=A0A6G9AQV9_9BACT|nr:S49 family peptidase [Spirosoma aureum]QIP14724.1 S49 family peptidase [Spirosoma aureum]